MKAEKGDKNAQFELGILYKKGSPIRVPDKKMARKWLRKAYDNGVEAAWQELDLLLNQ
jgi:TPR repeat protein